MDVSNDQCPVDRQESVPDDRDEVSDLIYLIGHDLRASSRALMELPGWIEEDNRRLGLNLPDSTLQALELMTTHARRFDRMTADLLCYSRIGRRQSPEHVIWDDTLDRTLAQCPLPDGFDLVRDIQAPAAYLGPVDAETLLGHLIGNAVKHHDRGRGTITVSTRATSSHCTLTVSDDGPGIPVHLRARALRLLTTLKSRDDVEGSGMGLAIATRIATFYGGALDWPPVPGPRGLWVRISLPLSG